METYQAVQAEIARRSVFLQAGASTPAALHQKSNVVSAVPVLYATPGIIGPRPASLGSVTLSTAAAQTNVKEHTVPPAQYARRF